MWSNAIQAYTHTYYILYTHKYKVLFAYGTARGILGVVVLTLYMTDRVSDFERDHKLSAALNSKQKIVFFV